MFDSKTQSQIPSLEGDPLTDPIQETDTADDQASANPLEILWGQIAHAGLTEQAIRFGTHAFLIVLVLIVIWVLRALYLSDLGTESSSGAISAFAAPLPTPTATMGAPNLPEYSLGPHEQTNAVQRRVSPFTIIPSRPRVGVITYTVQTGDSVFGIADRFALKPETILWGNYSVLADNPHRLQPGQILTILPVDGTYHKWSAGKRSPTSIRSTPTISLSGPGTLLITPRTQITPSSRQGRC